MSNEMRSTATVCRSPWRNATERSFTSSSFSTVASIISPERLARIKRVTHRLADEDQQRQHAGHGKKAREAEPRRLNVRLALLEQFSERGRAGRQPEAKKVERSERHHRR